MEDTTAPPQLQKRSQVTARDDDDAVAKEKPATSFIEEEEKEAVELMDMEEPDRTPHALPEIDFFYAGCATTTAGSCAVDQEPVVDVALTLGGKGPFVAGREDAVDATLRLGLGAPSAATAAVAALGEDDDDDDSLRLHLHGVPFSRSPARPKLDPTLWYPLPLADDPCHGPSSSPSPATPPEDSSASPEEGGSVGVVVPGDAFYSSLVPTGNDDAATGRRPSGSAVLDLNQPCSSEFPDDIVAGDVDKRRGRETTAPEQCHLSSTPYTFI